MDRVLDMGSGGSTIAVLVLAFALVFHGGLAGMGAAAIMFDDFIEWNRTLKSLVADRLAQTIDIQQEKAKEPPPPPPEEKKDETAPPPKAEPKEAPPPPPQAAQAGAVLTQAPDPNDPVDLTGGGFISGTGNAYAGGVTQAGATGGPTYNKAASAAGTPGGTGTAPAPAAPPKDLSRNASLMNPERWQRIEFPEEANTDGVDDAYVTLKIAVDAQGNPGSVAVVQDPGHGFARQAKQFALRQKYNVAFDREGNPIPGVCNPRIHFTR